MVRSVLAVAVLAAVVALANEDAPATRTGFADRLLVRLRAGDGVAALATARDDVWANDYGRGRLLRIGGGTARVLARLPIGRRLLIAAHRDSVWALRWGGRFLRRPNGPLFRIDARTNRVAARIPLRTVAFGIEACDSGLWVWGPSTVQRLEPRTGRTLDEFSVPQRYGELTGAAHHDGGLLATTADGHLIRFEPARGATVTAREPALTGAELLRAAERRVLADAAGTLVAADARTGRLLWRRPLGFRISTVLDTDGVLLAQGAAFNDPGDRIWALDPATGRVLATATLPSFGTTSMTEARGSLWVATAGGEVIVVPPLLTRLFLERARSTR